MGREGKNPQTTLSAVWNNPAIRALVVQALVLIGVVLLGIYLVDNTLANMKARGIASGFEFLGRTAGFSIATHLIDYEEANTYGRAFLVGLLNTLLVSVVGIVFATVLGFTIGVARLSNNWLISRLATLYIEIIRNVPLLLQLFFWYFAVLRNLPSPKASIDFYGVVFLNKRGLFTPNPVFGPEIVWSGISLLVAIGFIVCLAYWSRRRRDRRGHSLPVTTISIVILTGVPVMSLWFTDFPIIWELPVLKGFNFRGGTTIIPELVALTLALSLYTASFIAEVVRAGILSVNRGQSEAAYALGLHRTLTLRLVVIPQALRVIIPPLTNQYLNLTKNSSLAAAIAYPDLVLVFAGTTLMQTGQAVEIIAITMSVYLTLSLAIAAGMNLYNRHIALVER